ncbi:hypothetical protein ACES2L_08595 [Bdellovibrio bacteriovorus]
MKALILTGLLLASGSAFASMDTDIDTMIKYASLAVKDYAVQEVGMHRNYTKVRYDYKSGLFTARDSYEECSFKAKAKISYKRLATGHHWKVIEVPGTNTCN